MAVYGTLEGWRVHATERGDSAPSDAADGDATAALTRATDYVRHRLPSGTDTTDERVVEATYIAAGFELATPGLFGGTYGPGDAKVLTRVGEIQWERIPGGNPGDLRPSSPAIEALLAPLLRRSVGVMVV